MPALRARLRSSTAPQLIVSNMSRLPAAPSKVHFSCRLPAPCLLPARAPTAPSYPYDLPSSLSLTGRVAVVWLSLSEVFIVCRALSCVARAWHMAVARSRLSPLSLYLLLARRGAVYYVYGSACWAWRSALRSLLCALRSLVSPGALRSARSVSVRVCLRLGLPTPTRKQARPRS
jgi:hypothetical protein